MNSKKNNSHQWTQFSSISKGLFSVPSEHSHTMLCLQCKNCLTISNCFGGELPQFQTILFQVGFPAGDLLWKMGPATMVTARQQIAGTPFIWFLFYSSTCFILRFILLSCNSKCDAHSRPNACVASKKHR